MDHDDAFDVQEPVIIGDGDGLEEETDPGEQQDRRVISAGFVEEFYDMIYALHGHPNVVDVRAELSEPAPEFAMETFEHGLGAPLGEVVRSLYALTNGVEFAWNVRAGDEVVPGGEVRILDFGTCFGHWFETLWVHDASLSEEALDRIWSMRGLDQPQRHGARHIVALIVTDAGPPFEVVLRDEAGEVQPLHMDLYDYVYAAIDLMGVPGWQQVFAAPPGGHTEAQREAALRVFALIEAMFPERDISYYRWRLDGDTP